MSSDDPADDRDAEPTDTSADEGIEIDVDSDDGTDEDSGVSPRERLEREADKAVSEFDEGLVDLLAWLLDTETRARIYVYLRQQPHSTSEEVANGTGLYPSTVREALADLHDEEVVTRRKREHDGAGNNPYEYTAIAPSDLVRNVAEQVQSELNTVFNLDDRLGGGDGTASGGDDSPVSITVDEERTAADGPTDDTVDEEGSDADGTDGSGDASDEGRSDDSAA